MSDPEDFGAPVPTTTTPTGSVLAVQQREAAEVQTKFMMAERFPRNERLAVDRIVNAFSRPRLAELATYEYAKGGNTISGGSIHAAQAIAQLWGNMEFGHRELSRGVLPNGVPYSEVECFAHDLQGRTRRPVTIIVPHWRDTKGGGYRLKDEREVSELIANMAQRKVRGCIFSVVPQDVTDTALEQAESTLRAKADTSPEAVEKMLDAFAPFGVGKTHIEGMIQRRLDAITPAQVLRLKRIYQALRDEVASPSDWFDMGEPARADDATAERVNATREAIKGKRKPSPPSDFASFSAAIKNAESREAAAEILDASRGQVTPEEADELAGLYHLTWDE